MNVTILQSFILNLTENIKKMSRGGCARPQCGNTGLFIVLQLKIKIKILTFVIFYLLST